MRLVRRHPVARVAALAVLAALTVLCATAVAVWRSAHTDEASVMDHADTIVVLGAAQYGGRPSPVFEGRLRHAALLYREGFAPRILVVGGGKAGDLSTEADTGRSWLVSKGLPGDDVFSDPRGDTTFSSLEAAAEFMRQRDLRSAFLVSDPWHNLRIRRMARDLGLQAYVSATWHSAARRQSTRLSGYSREVFAYLYYRLLGR